MTGISEDTAAQLEMLVIAYKDLRVKKPGHELLSLVELHPDSRGFKISEDFNRRCVRDSDKWSVSGYARYTRALQIAAMGLPYELLDSNPPCKY